MPRTSTHVRETASRDIVRMKIDSFYPNGDALVREWSERDYGIDFVLELFDDGVPTGKIAFLQIKGTEKKIEKLARTDEVSCPDVTISSLEYAKQKRIPFVLIYASTVEPVEFYFVDLQSVVEDVLGGLKKENQKKVTVRIPYGNHAATDLFGFFDLVNSYYC